MDSDACIYRAIRDLTHGSNPSERGTGINYSGTQGSGFESVVRRSWIRLFFNMETR